METIKEDYVSFYIAKLLKQKEFDELCIFKYNYEGIRMKAGISIDEWQNSELDDNEYSCPTLQMAMKWLREMHHIFLSIQQHMDMSYVWYAYMDGFAKGCDRESHNNTYEEACEAAIKYCLENLI